MTKDDSSVELSKIELSKIKSLPYIKEISHGCNFDTSASYFTIDKGLIYKSGDTYRKSTVTYTVTGGRLQRPISRIYKIKSTGQLYQIAVEMFEINGYMEKVNARTYTYPSYTSSIWTLFSIDNKKYEQAPRGTEQYSLAPDLWKNTPLVQTFWKIYEHKGQKVLVLDDIDINEELDSVCLFTPKNCKNLLLLLLSKYRECPVIMSRNLTESLNNKAKRIRDFTFKLYKDKNGNVKGITVTAPEKQITSFKSDELFNNCEEYYSA